MNYAHRVAIYKEIEALRQRPLISYVTSSRAGAGSGQIGGDAINEITRQLNVIPPNETQLDLLIVSNGGDPTVAWRLISMIRERFSNVAVLTPFSAYSAATLVALGANEIWMHPFSNLGPVDPQLASPLPGDNQKLRGFSAEDLTHYFSFLRQDVGISDQRELQRAFELLCADVGAVNIGTAKRSTQLTLSLGRKLLSMHMQDANEATAIAESLNRSFFHHGYPLGRKEAVEIGLPVKTPDSNLESLMWSVWQSLEAEMQCNSPFNPVELLYNSPAASAVFGSTSQLQIAANLPPQVMQQAYNSVLQQIHVIEVEPVEYTLLHAVIESIRGRSQYLTKGQLRATRHPDMNLMMNLTEISKGWTFETNANTIPQKEATNP